MAFPTRLLNDDEEVVLDLHPHWWYLAPRLAALFGSLVIGLVLVFWSNPPDPVTFLRFPAGLLVLGCLVWFGARYAEWSTTHFVVTNQRLVQRWGLVHKQSTEIPLERINTVRYSQNLWERLLRYGDLDIESAGEQGLQKFIDIRKPDQVKKEIYSQKDGKEVRRLQRLTGATPQTPADSIPGQIRELDELRKQGLLSEEEFAAKKQELLDRM